MKHEGLRFNQGKLRYDLLTVKAIRDTVKVLTKGAEKYADHNWEKGMAWSTPLASLERHLADWKAGVDIDPDDGLSTIAKVATNALFLTEYSHTYQQGDDRQLPILHYPRVALDIDEVLAGFTDAYCKRFNMPRSPLFWNFDYRMKERMAMLHKDENFWMDIKPLITPSQLPFEPVGYITSRTIPEKWTKRWLSANGFPTAPLVSTQDKKIGMEKLKADILIDDSIDVFRDLNNNGYCCILYNRPHNEMYKFEAKRINSLSELSFL